jgi:hypothetical protein
MNEHNWQLWVKYRAHAIGISPELGKDYVGVAPKLQALSSFDKCLQLHMTQR